jgi:hypothetical protein
MSKNFKIVGNDISDGYHTFNELYEHRILLFINLCLAMPDKAVIGKTDGDWFVMFLKLPNGQISYHLHIKYLPYVTPHIVADLTYEWDGHVSSDVVERLKLFAYFKAATQDPSLQSQLKEAEEKLKIAVAALESQIKWKPNYKNDDGSDPDIYDVDSWDDVDSDTLREIIVDVFTTARQALLEISAKKD